MIALWQTSQKAFIELAGKAAGFEPTFAESCESCNHICRNFWQFRSQEVIFTRYYYLL